MGFVRYLGHKVLVLVVYNLLLMLSDDFEKLNAKLIKSPDMTRLGYLGWLSYMTCNLILNIQDLIKILN